MSQTDKAYQMSQCRGIPAKGVTSTPGEGLGIRGAEVGQAPAGCCPKHR